MTVTGIVTDGGVLLLPEGSSGIDMADPATAYLDTTPLWLTPED